VPEGDYVKELPTGAREYLEEQLQKGKVTKDSYLFKNNKKFFEDQNDDDLKSKNHEELSKIFIQERNKNKRVDFMSPLTLDNLKDCKILMINGGKTGCAIAPDGDLQNVYNNSTKGEGSAIIKIAINNGAKKLDCFDGFLPEYYSRFGFKEVERMKWNDDYAPANWDYSKYGRPDVVFMKL
jgi:hypothetical protein